MGYKRPAHAAGSIVHAMNRGAAGQTIFPAPQDFIVFLRMLKHTADKFGFLLHAYCLMPNHFHLLLQLTSACLETPIHFLETSYAVYFNQKYDRWGHIYARPFKSIECSTEDYYLELVRYIHLNPVRAGLVSDPLDWKWSSHDDLLAGRTSLIEARSVLEHFGEARASALENYMGFLRRVTDRDSFMIARKIFDSKEELLAFDPASERRAGSILASIGARHSGDRGRIAREARTLGFSITEIADYLNISRPYVWKYLNTKA